MAGVMEGFLCWKFTDGFVLLKPAGVQAGVNLEQPNVRGCAQRDPKGSL